MFVIYLCDDGKKNSVLLQARVPAHIVLALDKVGWTSNRSEVIRAIIESFFSLDPEEQVVFLQRAAAKKFVTN